MSDWEHDYVSVEHSPTLVVGPVKRKEPGATFYYGQLGLVPVALTLNLDESEVQAKKVFACDPKSECWDFFSYSTRSIHTFISS